MQVLIFALAVFALQERALAASTRTQQFCTTVLGTKSVKTVPATTITLTLPVTQTSKVTSTPVQRITPAAVTLTDTSTITSSETVTAPANTQTVISTTTSTATDTLTETASITNTATTTTTVQSTSTSTVPTPAGYTPLSQEPGYVPKIKGRDALGITKRAAPAGAQILFNIAKGAKAPTLSPALYPQRIVCLKIISPITVKVITLTATKSSTSTLPPVVQTTTSVTTTTTTSTEIPPDVTSTATASETVTSTTTTTSTSTFETTATATETDIVPGPTVYAACASDNIVSSANGRQKIRGGGIGGSLSYGSATNAYDCCVECHKSTLNGGNCRWNYFGFSTCGLISGNTCDAGQFHPGDYFETASYTTEGFTLSNGPCGAVQNAGSAG